MTRAGLFGRALGLRVHQRASAVRLRATCAQTRREAGFCTMGENQQLARSLAGGLPLLAAPTAAPPTRLTRRSQ